MTATPFYAVRVVLTDDSGSTYTRDYVRGGLRLGRAAFASFALGDLLRIIGLGDASRALPSPVTWTVTEISLEEHEAGPDFDNHEDPVNAGFDGRYDTP